MIGFVESLKIIWIYFYSCYNEIDVVPASLPRRVPISRGSDRPQSSQSSSATSTVVHGCGGRCQTFENVCYYFLQVNEANFNSEMFEKDK